MSLQWNTIFLIYLNVLLVSCARNSSLTFVIDDTMSMYDELDKIRLVAPEIMNIVKTEKASEIEEVVLVTFNDPDVLLRVKTSNPDTLLQALRNIKVGGGSDCPEYVLSGIEKALKESKPSSYLFVFTDASAKDHYKVNSVINLCERKQSQVLEIVKEAVKSRKTIVTSQNVPASATWSKIPFHVDDLSEYVVVSTSGSNVDLIINDSPTSSTTKMTFDEIMWKSSGKVVKFVAPKPGTYYAWVKADTDIRVLVNAKPHNSL